MIYPCLIDREHIKAYSFFALCRYVRYFLFFPQCIDDGEYTAAEDEEISDVKDNILKFFRAGVKTDVVGYFAVLKAFKPIAAGTAEDERQSGF